MTLESINVMKEVKVNQVFRMVTSLTLGSDETKALAFSDCRVIRVYEEDGEKYADLLRPYVCSDTNDVGAERINRVRCERLWLVKHWHCVSV